MTRTRLRHGAGRSNAICPRAAGAAALLLLTMGPAEALGRKAVADMRSRDGRELGRVQLVETIAGVLLRVRLRGVPVGARGLHIVESGRCDGDFASAGAIYNPVNAKHGFLNEEGPMAGDLPNIYVQASGVVEVDVLNPFVTLKKDAEESLLDSDGSAIVIRERADDYRSEPDGNAGARIACGVIVAVK
jgi:Cu-Zn family superoxide dismutase